MTALTIEVPDHLAEVADKLDGPLIGDSVSLGGVLRWSIHEAGFELAGIAEDCADPDAAKLRACAARIEALADVAEAVAVVV